jgi:hypothetical protein
MRATLKHSALLLASLALLAAVPAARAADDDELPSFQKRGDKEKDFVSKVGTAIVKAARTGPTKIELDEYKFTDPKKDRKDLNIKMNWVGGISKKKFVSTIVVKIDTSDDKNWEVLSIDYKDDNSVSLTKPNGTKIKELEKKFNRDLPKKDK